MNDYITGPEGLRLIKTFEGEPRLEARLCEGGRWELGYGCTFWPGDRPIVEGEFITPDQVDPLLSYALKKFEEIVKRLVTVELTQYQFDAHVSLVYNIGEGNYRTSTVLRQTNARRFEDAAAAFGMWCKATSSVDEHHKPWLGPDGQPCQYRRALRGLLRRHYAEGCLSLGYDFGVACADDAIAMRAEKVWEADNNRWHDRMDWTMTTPFSQVIEVARRYPLAAAKPIELPKPVELPKPAAPPPPAPKPVPKPVAQAAPAPAPAPKPEPVGTKPLSPNTVKPVEVPYRIDPNAGLKPLEESERAKGYWYQQAGIGMIRLGSLGVFGTTVQGGAQALQGDPVLSNLVLTGVVVGGIAVTGWVVKSYGEWRRKRGEKAATQGLF